MTYSFVKVLVDSHAAYAGRSSHLGPAPLGRGEAALAVSGEVASVAADEADTPMSVLPSPTRMSSPGATVELNGQRIHAGTVTDLYEQVFRLLLNNGKAEALKELAPYRTSNQRYLFAREPLHPNGKAFFVDVKVGPYHVEAHKNYEQAVKQLAELLGRLGISFQYLG